MSWSVVIPSKTPNNLSECVESIWRLETDPKVIAIWDGDPHELARWGPPWGAGPHLDIRPGIQPFIFSRNVNLGIAAAIAAGDDAVVITNDDTRLLEPLGLSWLVRYALDNPDYGVISAGITQHVGNLEQIKQPGTRLRQIQGKTLAFMSVCITAATFAKVGFLDERFTAYGWEDNDFCLRCRNENLKLGVFDGCIIEHGVLPSTFRAGNRGGDIEPGRKIFIDKWGSDSL